MAVNLIDSTDIEITQTGNNIQLSTTVDMQTLESNVSTNTSNISTNATDIKNLQTYSTNEVNTGKVWIDGKPIYRKVITGTTSNEISGGTEIETQIMTGVSNIVYADGYVETSSSLKFLIGSSWDLRVILVGNMVRLDGKDTKQYKNKPYKLILEYTKITD